MKRKSSPVDSAGFSLVELIVVVGILTVMVTIALPAYEGFQAKARRGEGLQLLNAFFMAAVTSQAQFGYFSGGFVDMGFQPTGLLNYRLRSGWNRAAGPVSDSDCVNTRNSAPHDCECDGACLAYKTWRENSPPFGIVGVRIGPKDLIDGGGCPGINTWDDGFNVKVGGVISYTAAEMDMIHMNHLKEITICFDGAR